MTREQLRFESPLGRILAVARDGCLTGLYFDGQKDYPDGFAAAGAETADSADPASRAVLACACRQIDEYFAGVRRDFDLPLALQGTPFQRLVWQALLAIPYGVTTSYAAIARDIRRPAAVRAVGAAVGRNPVSVIVPCHRVLGSNGSLTGYAGGLWRKVRLLAIEEVQGVAGTRSGRPGQAALF